jgi:hypothetical protein
VVRLDSSQAKVMEAFRKVGPRLETFPVVLVYFQNDWQVFEGYSINELIHFINKIVHPVMPIKTEAQMLRFLDLSKEPVEDTRFFSFGKTIRPLGDAYTRYTTKQRVIAFIFDKKDYDEELKMIRAAGRMGAKRSEMRIALITDKKIIKKYKAQYTNVWFGETSYTTLMTKRYDGEYFHLDILNDIKHTPIHFFINKKAVKNIDEVNDGTFRVYELTRQPILIAFVDFNSPEKSVT